MLDLTCHFLLKDLYPRLVTELYRGRLSIIISGGHFGLYIFLHNMPANAELEYMPFKTCY